MRRAGRLAGAVSRDAGRSVGVAFLGVFGLAAVGVGAARAVTTTYLPVLLERIEESPTLIGVVMLINPVAGFAVPLAVGVWSDRLGGSRPRLPFLVGGALLTAGGLGAVALGTESSYLVLVLAGFGAYVGLNAAATAHRAVIAERFEERDRPAATSAQEVAQLIGAALGVVAGGALVADSAALLFVAGGVAAVAFAAPTVAGIVRLVRRVGPPRPREETATPGARDLFRVVREPGPRAVLLAQVLWVMAYVALPAFFILYAREVFGLGAGTASLLLAGLGLGTAAGMLLGGATKPERTCPRLMLGVALLGGGLLAAASLTHVGPALAPFAAASVGFGLVSSLGYPYFARMIPAGEAGRYSGLYFAARAVAAAVALPLAGVLIEVTGSYRGLLLQGGAALLALIPLAGARRIERGGIARGSRDPGGAPPRRVAAVIPCRQLESLAPVLWATVRHVDELVVVDDSQCLDSAALLDAHRGDGVDVLRRDASPAKGDAVAAGVARLLSRERPADAIVVLDCDGQHPPDRIPDLVAAAAGADVVVGNRRGSRRTMPLLRRVSNDVSSALLSLLTRRRLPDSQCGMRLYRRAALERVPLPPGGYEAETRHLKAVLRAGLSVRFVPIPAIYAGEPSGFRPLVDSARVLRAIFVRRPQPPRPAAPTSGFVLRWTAALAGLVAATVAFGWLLVPALQGLDEELFLAINALGDGPDLLFEVVDPHIRNYLLLAAVAVAADRFAGTGSTFRLVLALAFAALVSYVLLELTYALYDRPRPSEVFPPAEIVLSHGNNWARIEAFPSGHLVVTTAIVMVAIAAVPALRAPLWTWIGAVGFTRLIFGAHFPLDVVAGIAFGLVAGRFAVRLFTVTGALPLGPEHRHPGRAEQVAARTAPRAVARAG